MTLFLGKPVEYWLELQVRADDLNVSHIMDDLARTKAKCKYLEEKVGEMANFVLHVDGMETK